MIQSRRALLMALIFPIAALAALTAYKKYLLSFGEEIVLPISGYDPVDVLSGHYLVYQIDYGVDAVCIGNSGQRRAYICLEPKRFSYTALDECKKLIRGACNGERFEAGIERYYVPEAMAKDLENQVRSKKASVVLSVMSSGIAQIKDLLIDGQPWKNQ